MLVEQRGQRLMLVLQAVLVVALAWKLIRQFRPPIRDWPPEHRVAEAVGWAALTTLIVSGFWERSGVTFALGVVLFVASIYLDVRYRR